MFEPWRLAAEASRIRLLVHQSMEVGNALLEMRCGDLAAKLCDTELQLMEVYHELLERVAPGSQRPQQFELPQDGVPF